MTNPREHQEKLVSIRDVKTYFPIKRGVFSHTVGHVRAVDGVSLDIHKGETVGLVGESGCGKTTLGRTIVRLEEASAGQIIYEDRDILKLPESSYRPLRRHLQMIFQDPFSSLNPRLSVRDIITEGVLHHRLLKPGMTRDALAKQLLSDVGMGEDAVHRYPHEFSGGQRQRISVARALSLQPNFIVCDEPVSALDVSVQAQVINLLMDLREKYDLSYLFISHDLSVVKLIAHRVAVMYLGQIVEYGTSEQIIENPKHPYTQALISAIPVPGSEKKQRVILEGDLPSPANPPKACRFHPRCPYVMDICKKEYPHERMADGRPVCCHLYPPGKEKSENAKPADSAASSNSQE